MQRYPSRLGSATRDEAQLRTRLHAALAGLDAQAIQLEASALIDSARQDSAGALFDVQAFLAAFPIHEIAGVNLLRLAEAMPRVADAGNQVALLADKLAEVDWSTASAGEGWFERVAATILALAKTTLPAPEALASGAHEGAGFLAGSVVRPAARAVIGRLGQQFVFATAIDQALAVASERTRVNERYSFDMLGEGARTWSDAETNLERYWEALRALTRAATDADWRRNDGLSIKVSAIHPRYELHQYPAQTRILDMLLPLCAQAAQHRIGITLDAEESERLEMHLDLFLELAQADTLRTWAGLGLAVQAYQARALDAIEALIAAARARSAQGGAPIAVRLVKGAYWDAEIKRAQELGLAGYPVHRDKADTDRCYAACAATLIAASDVVYPQFATHNAVTLALLLSLIDRHGLAPDGYEFQRLHGMGASVHAALTRARPDSVTRVYAPVGDQQQLLAYLIRRLLENGASTSFVRKLADAGVGASALARDELEFLRGESEGVASRPPLPAELFFPERRNSIGVDLNEATALTRLLDYVANHPRAWRALPIVVGAQRERILRECFSPARSLAIGSVGEALPEDVIDAVNSALAACPTWAAQPAEARAQVLEALADKLQSDLNELVALCVWEGGKSYADSVAEVREAVDLCRYYAAQARRLFAFPTPLPGPTGEANQLTLHGRGVFVCISPWNFPVAIYIGQIAAALAAGNSVIAKPAEQTPLIAFHVARLLLSCGLPGGVFHLLPGPGESVGGALVGDARIAGVAFTGSTATAKRIQRALAQSNPAIVPLVAETGGQNCMIVDSTALAEQVVDAVVASSFRSAGQRCSALRVLYVQDEIAAELFAMIRGAMQTLVIGDPVEAQTDVGPVIDVAARGELERHIEAMRERGYSVFRAPLPESIGDNFVAPTLIEIDSIRALAGEVFGPILHAIRFPLEQLDRVIEDINATGFGLTLGVHTRIEARAQYIRARVRAGNVYVNRNMIGAMVGVQPFGGEGLSGTGFKAGGPNYLLRFATERVYTVNTAAAGGDLALLAGR